MNEAVWGHFAAFGAPYGWPHDPCWDFFCHASMHRITNYQFWPISWLFLHFGLSQKMTFAMKLANLTILTPLVTSMRDPMTLRHHFFCLMGYNDKHRSRFDLILDDQLSFSRSKIRLLPWMKQFGAILPHLMPLLDDPMTPLRYFLSYIDAPNY